VEESSIATALSPEMLAGLDKDHGCRTTITAQQDYRNKLPGDNGICLWNFIPDLRHDERRFLPVYNTMFVEQQFTTAHEMGTTVCIKI
jgi:hypothetical protein